MGKWVGAVDPLNLARGRYYAKHYLGLLLPDACYRVRRTRWMQRIVQCRDPSVFERAAYCCQWTTPFAVPAEAQPFRVHPTAKQTTYQFDLHDGMRYFPASCRVAYRFGDVRRVPPAPALVKTRPIRGDTRNAVLLNLNKVRHFYFVRDAGAFADKRDQVVWRGRACQAHRKAFLARYHDHPLCDVGHYHRKHQDVVWTKPHLSIPAQLQYKFVLSLEGNDVATSLKWILSSRSLCLMARPRFESWFMEGRLVPGKHYVELRDDYADLAEKVQYYVAHPEAAGAILDAANQWVAQFRDPVRERMVVLLVLWRYLYASGQLAARPPDGPCA